MLTTGSVYYRVDSIGKTRPAADFYLRIDDRLIVSGITYLGTNAWVIYESFVPEITVMGGGQSFQKPTQEDYDASIVNPDYIEGRREMLTWVRDKLSLS
jgi:hypothetical protein